VGLTVESTMESAFVWKAGQGLAAQSILAPTTAPDEEPALPVSVSAVRGIEVPIATKPPVLLAVRAMASVSLARVCATRSGGALPVRSLHARTSARVTASVWTESVFVSQRTPASTVASRDVCEIAVEAGCVWRGCVCVRRDSEALTAELRWRNARIDWDVITNGNELLR